MRSVSGNVRFARSYPIAGFERTPPDKYVKRWMNVSYALVCGLSDSRRQASCRYMYPVCNVPCMYPSMCVRQELCNDLSGHVTVKTDEYRTLNGQEMHTTDAKRWFMRSIKWCLSFYGTRFESIQTPPPPNIAYSCRSLTLHDRMFKNKGDSYQKHKTTVCRVNERRRWRSNSLLTPPGKRRGGGYPQFFLLRRLGPSSYCLPPPPPKNLAPSQNSMKVSNPPKIFQFCIWTLRKTPRLFRITLQNSPVCDGPLKYH